MMRERSFACRVSGSRDTSGSGSRDTAFLTKSTSVSSSFFGCGSVHATFRCCKLSFRPIVQISNTENILLDPPRGGVPPRARQLSQRVVPGRACHPPRGVAHSRPREPPGGGSAPLRDETSTGPGHEPRKRCASSSTSSTSYCVSTSLWRICHSNCVAALQIVQLAAGHPSGRRLQQQTPLLERADGHRPAFRRMPHRTRQHPPCPIHRRTLPRIHR